MSSNNTNVPGTPVVGTADVVVELPLALAVRYVDYPGKNPSVSSPVELSVLRSGDVKPTPEDFRYGF